MANKFAFNPFTGTFDLVTDLSSVVTSVNGQSGDVILTTSDIVEGSNEYFTNERAQDAIGTTLTDTTTIDLTYNDVAATITASVIAGSITGVELAASVAGNGLTGGAGSSLAVGAGDGIDITANAVAVDTTVLRTSSVIPATNISYDHTSSGLTATNVQAALDEIDDRVDTVETNYIPNSEKGANNGLATLDGGGKVPVSQLPSSVLTYEGVWDASSNTPTLADGVGNAGMVYRVGTAGTQNLGSGPIDFGVGDYVIYDGSIWQKSDTTDAVASVNSQVGIVVLDATQISAAYVPTNYTPTSTTIKGNIEGIDTKLASILTVSGDLAAATVSLSNNQSSFADISGLAFANASTRAAEIQYAVIIDATSDLFEQGQLKVMQNGSGWTIARSFEGDDSSVDFTITNAGQLQYKTANYTGFSSGTIKFRAITLPF